MEEKKNIMEVNRRGFLKAAAFMSAAFMIPSGVNKVLAATSPKKTEVKSSGSNLFISEKRILGSGKAAMEVSAMGFGVMGINYNGIHAPRSDERRVG